LKRERLGCGGDRLLIFVEITEQHADVKDDLLLQVLVRTYPRCICLGAQAGNRGRAYVDKLVSDFTKALACPFLGALCARGWTPIL
jgi:hypothetical protein